MPAAAIQGGRSIFSTPTILGSLSEAQVAQGVGLGADGAPLFGPEAADGMDDDD